MTKLLVPWLFQTIAMLITAAVLPKLRVTSIFGAIFAVGALAMINTQLWDTALFYQIPDSFSTHALTLLVANGILFWIVVKLMPGIEIDGILPALVAPIVFTLISLGLTYYAKDVDWDKFIKKTMKHLNVVTDSAKEFVESTKDATLPSKK